MKVPFLSPRPSVPAPKPSTPAPVATPKPSAPVAKSAYTAAPPPVANPHADRIASAKAFLLNQPDPMAAKERQLSQLAAHLPPEDRHGVLAQITAMRTAAKQKLMGDLETVAVQQLPADQKAQYVAVAQELKASTDPVRAPVAPDDARRRQARPEDAEWVERSAHAADGRRNRSSQGARRFSSANSPTRRTCARAITRPAARSARR
ncbi:MAG: hypothetical protein QM767_15785 [Anaeromyxobacter sp.]